MNEVKVTEWRPCQKGQSLRGFATLELPDGMLLHDCSLHRRDDVSWVGMPGRQYTKQDGETAWVRIIDFADKQAYQRFQKAARAAFQRYFKEHGETAARPQGGELRGDHVEKATRISDADIPF